MEVHDMTRTTIRNGRGEEPDNETLESVREAYDSLSEALKNISLVEDKGTYLGLQRELFDLKAWERALDPEFQEEDLGGTRLNVPSSHAFVGDNPTAEDELGEVELPTRMDKFRVLDGVEVCDPENPHVTHGVTFDHVIETDGEVRVEVNALPLDHLGSETGSHIR